MVGGVEGVEHVGGDPVAAAGQPRHRTRVVVAAGLPQGIEDLLDHDGGVGRGRALALVEAEQAFDGAVQACEGLIRGDAPAGQVPAPEHGPGQGGTWRSGVGTLHGGDGLVERAHAIPGHGQVVQGAGVVRLDGQGEFEALAGQLELLEHGQADPMFDQDLDRGRVGFEIGLVGSDCARHVVLAAQQGAQGQGGLEAGRSMGTRHGARALVAGAGLAGLVQAFEHGAQVEVGQGVVRVRVAGALEGGACGLGLVEQVEHVAQGAEHVGVVGELLDRTLGQDARVVQIAAVAQAAHPHAVQGRAVLVGELGLPGVSQHAHGRVGRPLVEQGRHRAEAGAYVHGSHDLSHGSNGPATRRLGRSARSHGEGWRCGRCA